MSIKKYVYIGIGTFLIIVALAVGVSARFNLSNITDDLVVFVENFFNQWSPALAAAGTLIVAAGLLWSMYVNSRIQERDRERAIHALHDEIHYNLLHINAMRSRISERLQKFSSTPGGLPQIYEEDLFEPIDTSTFDNMKNAGQLGWLNGILVDIISCYQLIKGYNRYSGYKGHHLELLGNLSQQLDIVTRKLGAQFKFLPRCTTEKSESQEAEIEKGMKDLRGQEQASVQEFQKQSGNLLLRWIRKYSMVAFGVVAGIPIVLLLFFAISFTLNSNIVPLLGLGFVFDSLAAADFSPTLSYELSKNTEELQFLALLVTH